MQRVRRLPQNGKEENQHDECGRGKTGENGKRGRVLLGSLSLRRDRLFDGVFTAYGFLSLIVQLILLRELSTLFYGNELLISALLGTWLLWAGLGSRLFEKAGSTVFPWLFMGLLFLTPLEILLIRITRPLFGFGMTAGPILMVLTTAAFLFPVGAAVGGLFSAGCAWQKERFKKEDPSRLYFLESVGAIAGGVSYTFLFSGNLSHLSIAALAGAIACPALAVLSAGLQDKKRFLAVLAAVFAFTILCSTPFIEKLSRQIQWKGYVWLKTEDTRFSNLTITRTGDLKQLFHDGTIAASFPDPQNHEEIVHWPLMASKNPKNILLIGSGVTGELKEVLKHPIDRVDSLEIDPELVPFLRPYLDAGDQAALSNPRVHIHHADGRAYLKNSKERYDTIILNLPEPSTAQMNRFYTQEFFKEVRAHLTPGGTFALSIPSSENYLSPQTLIFNRSVFQSLRSVFSNLFPIPGDTLILLSSEKPLRLTPSLLAGRYAERNLKNIQMVPSYFPVKLEPGRMASCRALLEHGTTVLKNRDLDPVSYFYLWQVWLLKYQSPSFFLEIVAALFLLVCGSKLAVKNKFLWKEKPARAVFVLGFSGIVYEILLILAFQAQHGFVYHELGILFAAFMTGIAAGSWFGRRASQNASESANNSTIFLLSLTQFFFGITLSLLVPWIGHISHPAVLPFIYAALIAPVGFVPGFAFSRLLAPSAASETYSADLWGSALGACLTGLILVPLFGIVKLFWITALLVFTANPKPPGSLSRRKDRSLHF